MEPLKQVNIGRYEILAELGRGAMGVVYKARDPKIDRLVAVKTVALVGLEPEEEREFRARFFHEAQAAGRLSHPRIVTIFDVAEDPETQNPYIVMEYVAGHSLEKELVERTGKLPLDEALQLTEKIAEALDYAHAQGIVHRDIKPANILLSEDGHPKIADFGIAKFNLANITSSGHAIGTPAYMSPEQLSGEAVDGRSDLFSMGVILYTMLTGYKPFQGNSAMTVSYKVVNRDPVPVSALDADIPPTLDYVVSRAMAKDRRKRYQTGMELALDVQDLRQGFIPRSSMTPMAGGEATAGLSTGTHEPSLTARMQAVRLTSGSKPAAIGQPRKAAWPLWQYAAAVIMATGVLGIGFAMFRRPLPSNDPIPPGNQASKPVSEATSVSSTPAAAATESQSQAVKKELPPPEVLRVLSRTPSAKVKHVKTGAPQTTSASSATAVQYTAPNSPAASAVLAASRPASTLHIRVEHHFPAAEVWVWIDDKLAYNHSLGGTVKKHLVVFKGVQGFESDSLRIGAGDHRFRVRVQSQDKSYDKTATVTGSLPQDGERALHISCDKRKPLQLGLE
jgi:eukaryotic-like serine/threonine-protein kinase